MQSVVGNRQFAFSFKDIGLAKKDIPQYIGYKQDEIPEPFPQLIDEVYNSVSDHCDIKGGYIIYNKIEFIRQDHSLLINDIPLSTYKIIFNQLSGSEAIAAFLCTAGPCIEKWSKQLSKNGEDLKSYVVDTLGSLIVEYAMDSIQDFLKEQVEKEGMKITNRCSPGYCKWETGDQHQLFRLFPENFCGITLSDSALMHPVKSVSGIIGIGKDVKFINARCGLCDEKDCRFRKTGY